MPNAAPKHQGFISRVGRASKPQTDAVKFRRTSIYTRFSKQFLKKHALCFDPFYFHARDRRIIPARNTHHIISVEINLALALREDNCAALCTGCHSMIERMERAGQSTRRLFVNGIVTVLCGPPGSGKSTYVSKHKLPGDIIIDVDALMRALTGMDAHGNNMAALPLVLAAKESIIQSIQSNGIRGANAWLTTLAPIPDERRELKRRLNAKIIVFSISRETCLQRIIGDRTRDAREGEWVGLIDQWWNDYIREPNVDDETPTSQAMLNATKVTQTISVC